MPLRDNNFPPDIPLFVGATDLRAVEAAMAGNKRLIAVAQRDEDVQDPSTMICILWAPDCHGRKLRMPDGTTSIWVQGQRRSVLGYTR